MVLRYSVAKPKTLAVQPRCQYATRGQTCTFLSNTKTNWQQTGCFLLTVKLPTLSSCLKCSALPYGTQKKSPSSAVPLLDVLVTGSIMPANTQTISGRRLCLQLRIETDLERYSQYGVVKAGLTRWQEFTCFAFG